MLERLLNYLTKRLERDSENEKSRSKNPDSFRLQWQRYRKSFDYVCFSDIIFSIYFNNVGTMNNTIIISRIRALFLTGKKYTAKELNAVCGFNDSRKAISLLRANGMNIQDVRLENHCNLYWYVQDVNQLKLEL